MKKNKKLIIGILSLCLVAVIAISGTIAFLTDKKEVTNTFTVGDLEISLAEPSWDDATDGKNLMPGDTSVKDPTITQVKNDSYMRVKMTIVDDANNVITDEDRLDLILKTVRFDSTYTDADNVGTNLVEANKYSLADMDEIPMINPAFTAVEEKSTPGVYYFNYNTIFAENSKAVLFSNIAVPTDWSQTELNTVGSYKITLQAQAIQTDGFADAAEAFAALDTEIAKV